MVSTWSISLTALQIILLLDSLFAQSTGFNQPPDESTAQSQVENLSKQGSSYTNNSFLRNQSSDSTRYNNNPFLRNSARRSDVTENYTVKIKTPITPNTTIVVIKDKQNKTASIELSLPLTRSGENDNSRSERKCQEYYNEIESITPTVQLTADDYMMLMSSVDIMKGGIRHLVVGGREAKIQWSPHVVALGRLNEDKKFSFQCGGSIISPKWVLTAAHCTHGVTGGVTIARVGIQHLNDTNGETIPIKRSIRHPSYRPPAMYSDIALLELNQSVTFNKDGIRPACLHQHYHNISTWVWVCGWGATEFGGGESNTLQEAQLELVSNVECAIKHNRSIQVPDGVVPSMICAGAPNNNWQQDTCHGDSGGPLQLPHPTYFDFHQIVGITSFGAGCAFTDSPGVYTRVSHYLDWIENIVWPEL